MLRLALLIALGVSLSAPTALAALIVNPARPVTHQVSVQIIQTALDNGTSPAPVFGDSARQAAIEAAIDSIWSQAGIDIRFLPNVVRYNSTFAYQGLGGLRPLQDLNTIITGAQLRGGILNPDPSVLNMFFVGVTPGFDLKDATWATGVGNIGANGIAMFIGSSVSAEHAAHWVAHEIGHNLGLEHVAVGLQNLMATTRNTEFLTGEQIAAVFQTQARSDAIAYIPAGGTGFPKLLAAQIPGDYNRDGVVNTADYAVWRNTLGAKSNLAADGNADGVVDHNDYLIWRGNYGKRSLAAASAGLPIGGATVPEPATALCMALTAGVLALQRGYRRRR